MKSETVLMLLLIGALAALFNSFVIMIGFGILYSEGAIDFTLSFVSSLWVSIIAAVLFKPNYSSKE